MNLLNQIKVFNAIPPGIIKDDAVYVSNVLDKNVLLDQGAKGVLFVTLLGAMDIALAVLKVMESDTKTNGTTLGGSPTAVKAVATLPSATSDGGLALIYVPMAKWVEQFLQLQATAGDGTVGGYLAALAIADMAGDGEASIAGLNAISLDIA